jgi:hypothetical protein
MDLMKIGFSVSPEGTASVNALTDAESLQGFDEEAKGASPDETAVAFLDFTGRKTESRGDLGQAFEAFRLLIGLNTDGGSLCYAVEEMLEEVFEAGRKYERSLKG